MTQYVSISKAHKQLVNRLGLTICERTLRRMVNDGSLPSVSVGKRRYVDPNWLVAYYDRLLQLVRARANELGGA